MAHMLKSLHYPHIGVGPDGEIIIPSGKILLGVHGDQAEILKGETASAFESRNIVMYGAVGDGVANDTAAIIAALADCDHVVIPIGTFKVTSTITVGAGKTLVGYGYGSVLNASSVSGPVVLVNGGNGPTKVGGFRVTGSATTGVSVDNAQMLTMGNISLSGLTATDGFTFENTWASAYRDLFTNGATITNACFAAGEAFNANQCSNWYTSNAGCTYNILIDKNFNGGTMTSHGSQWSMLTGQGGQYGIYVREYYGGSIDGVYTENVCFPLRLGDIANTKLCYGMSFTGLNLGGPANTHTNYASRTAPIWLDNTNGVTISGVDLIAANGCANIVSTSFSGGGGSGARAVARITNGGVVHSVEVINPGSGYTTDPTFSLSGGGGSGFAYTLTRSGNTVASIAVTNGGSGYSEASARNRIAVHYHTCYRTTLSGLYIANNPSDYAPIYPWVCRITGAPATSGLTIIGDTSYRQSDSGCSADLRKTAGTSAEHALTEYTSAAAALNYVYTPPVFP